MAPSLGRPGVVVESFSPAADTAFRTGVAGFVCPAWHARGTVAAPPVLPVATLFISAADFADAYRTGPDWEMWRPGQLLWHAVQGFFLNGGSRCWVVLYDDQVGGDPRLALDLGVAALADIDDVDLVCAPSLLGQPVPTSQTEAQAVLQLQISLEQQLIWSAETRRDDWFLVLDAPSPPAQEAGLATAIAALRDAPGVIMPDGLGYHMQRPKDAAIYQPWLAPGGDVELPPGTPVTQVPPSGHVAGIFARSDARVGVHKAPANEEVEGIVDVVADVDDVAGANAVRALPGRGIRVWGARTLAPTTSPGDLDAYVGVRRLIVTLDRWLVRAMDWTAFETNDIRTWVRIQRELGQRLTVLFQQGALHGGTPDEAFFVKCDDENNPADVRAAGRLYVDIGVAPAVPKEFIKLRLIRSAEGITVA